MAKLIIDLFEEVDIHADNRQWPLMAVGFGNIAAETFQKMPAIGQACQCIGAGFSFGQLFGGFQIAPGQSLGPLSRRRAQRAVVDIRAQSARAKERRPGRDKGSRV